MRPPSTPLFQPRGNQDIIETDRRRDAPPRRTPTRTARSIRPGAFRMGFVAIDGWRGAISAGHHDVRPRWMAWRRESIATRLPNRTENIFSLQLTSEAEDGRRVACPTLGSGREIRPASESTHARLRTAPTIRHEPPARLAGATTAVHW